MRYHSEEEGHWLGAPSPTQACWLQKVVQAASTGPGVCVFWNLEADRSLSCSCKVAQAIWDIQSCSSRVKFRLTGCDCSDISKEKYKLRFKRITLCFDASLVAQTVKNLSAMQETWVRSLSWKDSLEKGMATSSSILTWKIPWAEEPSRLQSMGSQRVRNTWATNTLLSYWVVKECKPRK